MLSANALGGGIRPDCCHNAMVGASVICIGKLETFLSSCRVKNLAHTLPIVGFLLFLLC